MLEHYARERFLPHRNTRFQLEAAGQAVAVELIEVSEVRLSGRSEAFSLVFRGPNDVFLPQSVYRFHHAALGDLDLFVVPIGRDEHGVYYEAVFNTLRPIDHG